MYYRIGRFWDRAGTFGDSSLVHKKIIRKMIQYGYQVTQHKIVLSGGISSEISSRYDEEIA